MQFGLVQSPPDPRDWIYSAKVDIPALPRQFLRTEYPVGKQLKGDCVGWSGVGVKEVQENTSFYRRYKFNARFIYDECKKIDGMPGQEGTHFRALMKVLQSLGAALNSEYFSYDSQTAAGNAVYEEAARFKVSNYAKIQTLDETKAAIYQQGAAAMGVLVCENFVSNEGEFIAEPEGRILGLHAITATGWSDELRALRIRNSWGSEWKSNGYAWLPYDLLSWRSDIGISFVFEAWSTVDLPTQIQPASKIELWEGRDIAVVDGVMVNVDQSVMIDPQTNRMVAPARFIAEMAGYVVVWDGDQRKAVFTRR